MSDRRVGDTIRIEGGYQHNATHRGRPEQRFWHQKRFQTCLQMLSPESGMNVLDVGCGSGVFAHEIAASSGARVLAVDANPRAIEFAQAHYDVRNLEFRCGIVDELELGPRSFDQISFLEVIEHIYPTQALQALRYFHECLKPGGRLIVSTPNVHSAWPLIEWTMDRFSLAPTMEGEQHVVGYHPSSLTDLCRQAGFHLEQSRTIFVLAPWLASLSWRMANLCFDLEQSLRYPMGSLLIQTFTPVLI